MSTAQGQASLTPQEALARQLIVERAASRRHAPRQTRRHIRAALLLRSLAERLDPSGMSTEPALARPEAHRASSHHLVSGRPTTLAPAHAGSPRPWSSGSPRSAHRHS